MNRIAITILLLVLAILVSFFYTYVTDTYRYVSAVGGNRCYVVGHENPNIKKIKFYKTLEECVESIKYIQRDSLAKE